MESIIIIRHIPHLVLVLVMWLNLSVILEYHLLCFKVSKFAGQTVAQHKKAYTDRALAECEFSSV